jgi:hypothetical protein
MDKFSYSEHPHVEARKKVVVKRLSFNSRIGLFVTKGVGTMWAAYVFLGLTLVSLPAAIASGSVLVMVSWVAQTFLQLVLLPIIIVGQNIQAAASDARAKATYDDATAILHEAKQIQAHLHLQDSALDKLIKDLARVEKKVK